VRLPRRNPLYAHTVSLVQSHRHTRALDPRATNCTRIVLWAVPMQTEEGESPRSLPYVLAVRSWSLPLRFLKAWVVQVAAERCDLSDAGRVVESVKAISDGPDLDERG
jgi:hypothetical protein